MPASIVGTLAQIQHLQDATDIPENERWLHAPQAAASLQAALAWSTKNAPQETDIDALISHAPPSP